MPATMAAFSLAAFGMIGVPPMAGFVSKWYLATGAVTSGDSWVLAVLAASTALNAAYFLPILYAAWFKSPAAGAESAPPAGRLEIHWMLLLPPVLTALLALLSGVLAEAPLSPLWWSRMIVAREYLP
jgi:multicomponent Na+:H+ antiporter subunit D